MTWKIERRLGLGSSGEVSLAVAPSGERVAVKTFQGELRASWQEEIFLLSALKHPGIVRFLGCAPTSREIFGEERGPCVWMEHVAGDDLLTAAQEASPGRIFDWLTQALEALSYLHGQGLLHGDLSPGNVRIAGDGKLKLLDFGLASLVSQDPALTAGTVPYMAPEIVGGHRTFASDLFSLGTVFFEALAGTHPRGGGASLADLWNRKARSLLDRRPELAPDFEVGARVLDGMIEIDEAFRFRSADETLKALNSASASVSSPSTTAPYHPTLFYGAERDLETLDEAFSQLERRSALFAVHGITGVGKTRFLKEASLRAALKGVKVREVPPRQFKEGLAAVFGKDLPSTAFFFTDLQEATAEDLSDLLKLKYPPFSAPGRLLVLEWNEDLLDGANRDFLARFLEWPLDAAPIRDVRLENLSRRNAARLAAAALGDASKAIEKDLFAKTSGNPLLLLRTVEWLKDRGASAEKLSIPSFDDVLLKRIEKLAPEERDLIDWIAVGYGAAPFSPLAALIKSTPAVLRTLILELTRKDLVRFDAVHNGYVLSVPALAPALLSRMPAEESKRRHRLWLDLVKDRPDAKLHHAMALGDENGVIGGIFGVLDRCWADGRKREVLEWVDRALKTVTENVIRSRLFKEKQNLLNDLGRYEEALEASEAWFALGPDNDAMPLKTVKYGFATGLSLHNLGRYAEAKRRLSLCLEESVARPDPAMGPYVLRARTLRGACAAAEDKKNEAREEFTVALSLPEAKGPKRAEILRNLASIEAQEGSLEAAEKRLQEAESLYRAEKNLQGLFAVELQRGNIALQRGNFDAAQETYRRAEAVADELDNYGLRATAWHNLGVVARRTHRYDRALEDLTRALDVFETLGRKNETKEALKNLAIAEASVGLFEKAGERIRALKAAGSEAPDVNIAIAEAESLLAKLRDGAGVQATTAESAPELQKIYDSLPPALRATFVRRRDFRPPTTEEKPMPESQPHEAEPLLDKLEEFNRRLIRETDMKRILRALMDAAMEIAHAQNGFLVVRDPNNKDNDGPLPGFTVAVSRNVRKESLENYEDVLSLSVVRQAIQSREVVLADNALSDPRFRDAKSVHLAQLKSIIAIPLVGNEGVVGVFYLDHPLQEGLFKGLAVAALRTFAGIAALALQKEDMIGRLKAANERLSEQVTDKTAQVEVLEREVRTSRLALKHRYQDIIGRSPKMIEALTLVDKITASQIPVWIFGESGTGKEAVARALHFNSARAAKPFVTENCSALPEALLESELFGHKKGSFTHATADKKGILEYADGGTIFLDEIADMSLTLQAKLLRFLQEGEIRPIGSNHIVKVNVRVVSASNKDLAYLVREGKFREDLFFRLNGINVVLPPLRERVEDIPLLTDHFLGRIAEREKAQKLKLSEEALDILLRYDWPGNIRELQNTLETAVLFAKDGMLKRESFHFKKTFFEPTEERPGPKASSRKTPSAVTERTINMNDDLRELLLAIREHCYHKGDAAVALGISRRHLYTKLMKYGIPPKAKALKDFITKHLG